MACETVLIGHPDCYRGTGLQAGVHYLPYHHNVDELLAIISQANQEPQRIKEMAMRAARLVKERYTPKALWQQYLQAVATKE